jgi:hypothetical protein
MSFLAGLIIGSILGIFNYIFLVLTTCKSLSLNVSKSKTLVISSYLIRLTIVAIILSLVMKTSSISFFSTIIGLLGTFLGINVLLTLKAILAWRRGA